MAQSSVFACAAPLYAILCRSERQKLTFARAAPCPPACLDRVLAWLRRNVRSGRSFACAAWIRHAQRPRRSSGEQRPARTTRSATPRRVCQVVPIAGGGDLGRWNRVRILAARAPFTAACDGGTFPAIASIIVWRVQTHHSEPSHTAVLGCLQM